MEWTGLNELREKYLTFFEGKGHLRLPSFSLVPQGDKSLLLINAGMAPMKKYFTGELTPPRRRVTTSQKCIRTPDIERVGKTARHGTYFEMLGNFSFGDYFKHEATAWAWEFCTKVMEMPVERLWVTIFQDDDEAFDIWTKEVGVDASHIVRLGKEDNFWEHGSGPCGPCSEIYFDRGEKYSCGSPTCGVGCDCDRYVEFWNLVFTQFENDGNNNYTRLKNPNIDTGMGLERLACIMQGVENLFEVDTVQNIMKHVSRIAGVGYGDDERKDVSLRVITDHIRSTTFMIGDGVMPSNEGRGYVLRRLLRRAARHGRLLGIREPFLYQVCETVIHENASAYPELQDKADFIKKLILVEEESFGKTIDAGLSLLDEMLTALKGNQLSGADAFKLYDTYGFPLDLTEDILSEKGLTVDEAEFQRLMAEQRARARAARKDAGADAWKNSSDALKGVEPGRFVGYEALTAEAKVTALVKDDRRVDEIADGDAALVLLDVTPFYGESGGQVGDIGTLTNEGVTFEVQNTVKGAGGILLHVGEVKQGTLRVGDTLTATVDGDTRAATMRNHTSAHLLQAALRSLLGTHVEQAGQLVTPDRMRFDFTHFSALTAEQIAAVEAKVNEWILAGVPADIKEMPIDEARALGAMALFGEKYGDVVRVVRFEGVSTELCGGTHVDNTAKIGLFRILSESSVAAGVRRIEAVTGLNVLKELDREHGLLLAAADAMKATGADDVVRRAGQLTAELKAVKKELADQKSKAAADQAGDLFAGAADVSGVKLATALYEDMEPGDLRTLCDSLKSAADKNKGVLLLASTKGTFVCYCSSDAIKAGANAGNLIKATCAFCGGKGGGRPDSAMGGGKDTAKAGDALAAAADTLKEMLK